MGLSRKDAVADDNLEAIRLSGKEYSKNVESLSEPLKLKLHPPQRNNIKKHKNPYLFISSTMVFAFILHFVK